MFKTINKHILFPAYLAKNGNGMLKRLKELEQSQFYREDRLRSLQLQSLQKLLTHCYLNVPFYRERFDSAGFQPGNLTKLEDIKGIPYLTKADIQNYREQLIARTYSRESLVPDSSGGSTGKPTCFFKDLVRHQIRRADQIRHDRWCGWDMGEKFVTLWGAQREFEKTPSLKERLVERYLYRVFGFNAFDITEQKVLEYLEELHRIRPTMIIAYANVAFLFANIIQKHGIDLSRLKLKGLISSAETLTEEKREAIESAFGCKVLNRYGSREVGLIASECPTQEGLHINAENVLVEIRNGGRDADAGELGEIIVTDLWNYGMPFVRYQMGDVGVRSASACSCGRGLPLLKEVTGRVSDFIVDTSGGLVHGEYFTHLFYGLTGIEQFQLIQEERERITLKILPSASYQPHVLEPVIAKIKLCLGDAVQVNVQLSDSSMIETSGKFRFTISRISSDIGHYVQKNR